MNQGQRKSWKRRVLVTCSAVALGALGPGALAATPSGLTIEREWYRAIMGVGIGATGLHAVDLDGDGKLEVVAAAGPRDFFANNFWYVLSQEANGYGQKWVSLPYASNITGLRVAQVDADSPREVLVASGGKVYIHDGATRELQKTVSTPATELFGLSVADVDADGNLELVFCDSSKLYVVDLTTGTVEFQGLGLGGKDVAVGQVDADAALEIIVANGTSAGSVVDGATRAVEWSNASGFGDLVRVGDLDGDGRAEIAAGFTWTNGIKVYDGDTRTLAWSVAVSNLAAMRAVDVEGDGALELVYGDAQWGSLHVLTGTTGVQKWALSNPEHGVTDLAVGDVDGDSVRELLWGAGYSSSGADYLYVANPQTRVIEWKSVDLNGPFRALATGDVDADGKPELLSASTRSNSGYSDGVYSLHDAASHALEYQSTTLTGSDGIGTWRIASANVDADPAQEVFVTSSVASYDGVILCRDGVTHAEQWQVRLPSGLSVRSLAVVDVDGDGTREVVSSVGAVHSGAPGHSVYVHDAATGALEWQSPSLVSSGWLNLSLLRVANVDADPALEAVVAHFSGQLWVVDPVARSVQLTTADLDITALDTPDRNGDGRAELVIGSAAGALQVLDATTGSVVEAVASVGGQVNGLAVRELTGDGVADYVFSRGNQLRILNGSSRAEEWASEVLGSQVGDQDALLVGDVDADGRTELVVGTELGFMVFDLQRQQASPGARYDAVFKAPRCQTVGSVCDSGLLLLGRGGVGPELNAPNTLFSSCADGPYGTYHADESNDRLRVLTVDGTPFAAGKTVRVEATVWAWAGGPASDKLDLYFAADANNPSWQYLTTLTPTVGGEQTLSATYVLPAGTVQAVRARFRYAGSVAACAAGSSYDDQDDLVFAVQ